jgi:hypothetical protein
MVQPVTGPIPPFNWFPSAYEYAQKERYRQRKPYTLVLPYQNYLGFGKRTSWDGVVTPPAEVPILWWVYHRSAGEFNSLMESTYASAHDKLVSKVRGKHTAALGTSLAEAGESIAMIANRATSITKAYKAFRKGRLGDVYDALTLKDKGSQGRVNRAHDRARSGKVDFSNAYLELSFGWKPLIQDIYDAVDTLQKSEFNSGWVKATSVSQVQKETGGSDSGGSVKHTRSGSIGITVGTYTRISNPNLALANQLGLVNPALVAWNVIPFSYLVNWFVPVDRFLESFSWDWGFSTEQYYITHHKIGEETVTVSYTNGTGYSDYKRARMTDRGGPLNHIPVPKFWSRVKLPGGDLLGKASTSVAVLIQQLAQRK